MMMPIMVYTIITTEEMVVLTPDMTAEWVYMMKEVYNDFEVGPGNTMPSVREVTYPLCEAVISEMMCCDTEGCDRARVVRKLYDALLAVIGQKIFIRGRFSFPKEKDVLIGLVQRLNEGYNIEDLQFLLDTNMLDLKLRA